jgi:sulfur carrier protein
MANAKPFEPDPIKIGGGTVMQKAAVQDKAMTLTVNGERKTVRAASPRGLLGELEFEGEFFAIAVNRRVIPRAHWNEEVLRDGDSVEIVTPRQGG